MIPLHLPLFPSPTVGTSVYFSQSLRGEFYAHIPSTRLLVLLSGKTVTSSESSPLRRRFFPVLGQCTVIEPFSKQ